jgi:penicillin-binding protein 1B
VVWLGYDDNRAARLSGAASALPVWGEMMASLNPEPLSIPKPDGVETVLIDVESGLRADASCSGARELPFAQGSAPTSAAPCASQVGVAVEVVKERAKTFFERLFGR